MVMIAVHGAVAGGADGGAGRVRCGGRRAVDLRQLTVQQDQIQPLLGEGTGRSHHHLRTAPRFPVVRGEYAVRDVQSGIADIHA